MLQAAKVPIPDVMQGRDIAPMYLGGAAADSVKQEWRKQFYYEWFTGHKIVIPASLALVAKDVKYIIYPEYEVSRSIFSVIATLIFLLTTSYGYESLIG